MGIMIITYAYFNMYKELGQKPFNSNQHEMVILITYKFIQKY